MDEVELLDDVDATLHDLNVRPRTSQSDVFGFCVRDQTVRISLSTRADCLMVRRALKAKHYEEITTRPSHGGFVLAADISCLIRKPPVSIIQAEKLSAWRKNGLAL